MNASIFSLAMRKCAYVSPFVSTPMQLSKVSFSVFSSAFMESFSTFAYYAGPTSSVLSKICFLRLLSRAIVIGGSTTFTNQTSRLSYSSSVTLSNVCFIDITSSSMGGAILISSSSATVVVTSCEFIRCVTSYYSYSAGGISAYQALNFTMQCSLFDNCSSTAGDTNSFQVNSYQSYVPYCTVKQVFTKNGGAQGIPGREIVIGGSSSLVFQNVNVTKSSTGSYQCFTNVKPLPSGSTIGEFCQCFNCNGTCTLSTFDYETNSFTMEYTNFYNNSGNSYFFTTASTSACVTISHCVLLYTKGIALTSFSASSSYYLTFANCSFSWNPTSAQIMGNSITGSNEYNVSSNALNDVIVTSKGTCFLYSPSYEFTSSYGCRALSMILSVIFIESFALFSS